MANLAVAGMLVAAKFGLHKDSTPPHEKGFEVPKASEQFLGLCLKKAYIPVSPSDSGHLKGDNIEYEVLHSIQFVFSSTAEVLILSVP